MKQETFFQIGDQPKPCWTFTSSSRLIFSPIVKSLMLLGDFYFLVKLAAPVGNRTRVPSLQVMCSTIELQEHLLRDFSFLAKLVLSEGFEPPTKEL